MQDMHVACRTLMQRHWPDRALDPNAIMAGLHIATSQDFLQHQPTAGSALFKNSRLSEANFLQRASSKALAGRRLWLQFDSVYILEQQHRFTMDTEDGAKLHTVVQQLMSEQPLSMDEAAELCDELQSRVVPRADMPALLRRQPKVIVLRNAVRFGINMQLALHHAHALGKRLVMWRCRDIADNGMRVSPEVMEVLEHLPPRDTAGMPTVQCFFPGMHYVFYDNKAPQVYRINNQMCIGRALVLNALEPDDDLTQPVRYLRYPPLALHVQPDGPPLGDVCGHGVPRDCIPITAIPCSFNLTLQDDVPLYKHGIAAGRHITVKRRGIPLNMAYCVTGACRLAPSADHRPAK